MSNYVYTLWEQETWKNPEHVKAFSLILGRKPSLWRHFVTLSKKAELVKAFYPLQNAEPMKAFHISDRKAEEAKASYPGSIKYELRGWLFFTYRVVDLY